MTQHATTASAGPGAARCPVCGKPAVAATRPFCSVRCADVDLGRWLTEQYRAAGAGAEQDKDVPSSDESDTA